MTFTKVSLENWDDRVTSLIDRGIYYEAHRLLMQVYHAMVFCNKRLSEHEIKRLFHGIGATSYAINENQKAIYFFDSILSMSDEFDKNYDPDVASAIVGKAVVLARQAHYIEAFKIIDDFSRFYNKQFLLEEYPNIYVELAYMAKQYDMGISFGYEAIDVAKRKKTYLSRTMISLYANLYSCFEKLKKWHFACEIAEERLKIIEILQYENSQEWVDNIIDCVRCYCRGRQYKRAKEFIDKLDKVEFDKYSEDEDVRMQYLRYVFWKGFISQNLRKYDQAEIFYELCAKEVKANFSKYPSLKNRLDKQQKKLLNQKKTFK